MSTTEPDPLTHQDGNLDAEKSIFCCGEPIWPKGKHPFRAEYSLSCGWVIVDPDGRESTLGYASQKQADDVAEKMTYAYHQGGLLRPDALNREKMLRDVAAALGVPDSLDIATCNVMLHVIDALKKNQRYSDPPPATTVLLPDGRDVKISQAGMDVLLAIADGNPLGAYITAGILDWNPPAQGNQ